MDGVIGAVWWGFRAAQLERRGRRMYGLCRDSSRVWRKGTQIACRVGLRNTVSLVRHLLLNFTIPGVHRDMGCNLLRELARSGVDNALHRRKGVNLSHYDSFILFSGQGTVRLPFSLRQKTNCGSKFPISRRWARRLGPRRRARH